MYFFSFNELRLKKEITKMRKISGTVSLIVTKIETQLTQNFRYCVTNNVEKKPTKPIQHRIQAKSCVVQAIQQGATK